MFVQKRLNILEQASMVLKAEIKIMGSTVLTKNRWHPHDTCLTLTKSSINLAAAIYLAEPVKIIRLTFGLTGFSASLIQPYTHPKATSQ